MKRYFKKGDRVKILCGHPIIQDGKYFDINPEWVGKEAVIEYSYYEEYGGDPKNDWLKNSYAVCFLETNENVSWFNYKQLELIK